MNQSETPEPQVSSDDVLAHADLAALQPSGPGSLRDQGSLIDADGNDIREYTGEPVETDEGWVIPQSQNVGAQPDPRRRPTP